jgi:hypothetical protein
MNPSERTCLLTAPLEKLPIKIVQVSWNMKIKWMGMDTFSKPTTCPVVKMLTRYDQDLHD